MVALLAATALRISVILAVALAVAHAARRTAAATRHCIVATAICGSLAMPVLTTVLPRWHSPLSSPLASDHAPGQPVAGPGAVAVQTELRVPAQTPGAAAAPPLAGRSERLALLVVVLWFAGALCTLLVVVAGLVRLRWIARAARPVVDGPWAAYLRSMVERDPRLARVQLLRVDHRSLLVTWGVRRPRIVIPAGALSWEAHRIAIVLEHEAAHIRRADWMLQLAAHLLCALAWFDPLAWIAAARLRLESEHACDDAVIEHGIAAADYAEHLLHIARDLAPSGAWMPAPAMARTSSLERRITIMLDNGTTRRPISRFARRAVVALGIAATASIASFAAQSQFATFSGTVHDQLGGTIPRVTLTLTHVQSGAKHEVKSSDRGGFEFVGLPAGNYALTVTGMGFEPLDRPLQFAGGQILRQDVTLELGTLQETLTVRDGPSTTGAQRNGRQWTVGSDASSACVAQPNSGGIKPPMKIQDRKPVYPPSLRGTGSEGRVELAATIGPDGTVATIRTVDATSPEFELAAQDAVRLWRFTPTLLNCIPVEADMQVLAVFTPETVTPPAAPTPTVAPTPVDPVAPR